MQSTLIKKTTKENRENILKKITNKVPTSKVYKYPTWDKRMPGMRCGKGTGRSPVNPIDFI